MPNTNSIAFQILPQILSRGIKLTPMMEQYYQVKKLHTDALLLFRMGDFFEVFFEDAQVVAKAINITLTTRGSIGDVSIPMAGIPHHAASNYIDKLTSLGYRVVLCDQIEDPKFAKGIVKRGVTQIVGPGIPYDIDKSSAQQTHFIAAALKQARGKIILVFIDYVHGNFFGFECENLATAKDQLLQLRPKEFLSFLGQWENSDWNAVLQEINCINTYLSAEYFSYKNTTPYLKKIAPYLFIDQFYKNFFDLQNLLGSISYFLCATQKLEKLENIKPFVWQNLSQFMQVSYQTLAGLEILPKNHMIPSALTGNAGAEQSSGAQHYNALLSFIDKTLSPMGHRLLLDFFRTPLKDKLQISARHKIITNWQQHWNMILAIREHFTPIRDLNRILTKATSGKINLQDLIALGQNTIVAQKIFELIKEAQALSPWDENNTTAFLSSDEWHKIHKLSTKIISAINPTLGASLEKGNAINAGFSKQRDELGNAHLYVADKIAALELKYREQYNLPNVRIKSNNISGHYIEVSKSYAEKVPSEFIRMQTLTNVERFQSKELIKIEKSFSQAQEQLYLIEKEIFLNLVNEVLSNATLWHKLASQLALVDIFQSLTFTAVTENLCCPEITEEQQIYLEGVWHPLIKARLHEKYISHDIHIDAKNPFLLITGPNMAGKTTVMREIAISQFLAQIGSYVPAKVAKICICDALYSRLGASDDISNGQSTFMVEMNETAEILRHATKHSLILLDEIGRGTSTHDGLSIAWAIMEYLVKEVKAITLFSTHYHELIQVADHLKGARNVTVKTLHHEGDVQFLYELIDGGATQSFGIYVAKLAGLPKNIIGHASKILHELESQEKNSKYLMMDQPLENNHPRKPANIKNNVKENLKENLKEKNKDNKTINISEQQLSLFESMQQQENKSAIKLATLQNEFAKININNLTPLQALNKLHELNDLF